MKLIKRRNYNPTVLSAFDDFFTKDLFGWENNQTTFKTNPGVNVIENDENFSIHVAAPGLTKEDFNVELDNNLLTISFEKKDEVEENGKFTKREFHYTSFKRSFTLPEATIDTDSIDASYEAGILNLVLPKKEEAKAKAKRSIEIG